MFHYGWSWTDIRGMTIQQVNIALEHLPKLIEESSRG